MDARLVSTSKFLSLILRHKPEEIGLVLDAKGWADVDELILAAEKKGKILSRALIEEVVAGNDKKRFVLSADGRKIRANQGHSVLVDLGLEPRVPPDVLYHGTATRFLESIQAEGLKPGNRQHVHLSTDEATATKVGQRHGKPVVLKIRAAEMVESGSTFFLSENGVWLTLAIAPGFIEFPWESIP